MVSSLVGVSFGAVSALAIALGAIPAYAGARELATAQGTIAISEARAGLRAPSCSELVVEARNALDNHLISETQPTADEVGTCRYALSVPAQTAIWLRLQPVLAADVRVGSGISANTVESVRTPLSSGSVALRFTVIASTTYFFAPNEQKTVRLSY